MKNICFAYFADNKFIGWYSDSFGTITENSPKIYTNTDSQIDTITANFKYKLSKLKEESNLAKNPILQELSPLDNSLNKDKKFLSQYKEVELRVVDCPFYDGVNPDFDKEAYVKKVNEQTDLLKAFLLENGIEWNDGPSLKRINLVEEFHKTHPRIKSNNWIYADYKEVNEWAKTEPTQFLKIIKHD